MKKIYIFYVCLFAFMINSESVFAKKYADDLEQKYLLDNLKDLFEQAPVYEKYQNVHARDAKDGEKIVTVTSDGIETINTAKKGDIVVKNLTKAGEEYILTKSKFASRYMKIKDVDKDWAEYKPLGEAKAIKVDDSIIKKLSTAKTFYIMAVWGERMVVKKGDYLVSPLDYSEVYRIAGKEFFETYRNK